MVIIITTVALHYDNSITEHLATCNLIPVDINWSTGQKHHLGMMQICTWMRMCMYVYKYVCKCMYKHTHTHTHCLCNACTRTRCVLAVVC